MSGPRVDPRLRAELHEWAREIMRRDRAANKAGRSQNTIGEIERALIRAYRLGREEADSPAPPPRPDHLGLDWEEVKPRGREVLMSMTYRSDLYPMKEAVGLCRLEVAGRVRWAEIRENGRQSDHSVAAGSVDPLLRTGLLAPRDDGLLVLTPKGRATCEAYWRRRAEGDLTLPKESIRV